MHVTQIAQSHSAKENGQSADGAISAARFHILVEADENSSGEVTCLEVPPEGCGLRFCGKDKNPELVPLDSADCSAWIEPVRHQKRSRLLLLRRSGTRVRVNAQLAPLVMVLHGGDQVRVEAARAMEVAVFHSPYLGAPTPELVGKACMMCRAPLTVETRIYRCANCGGGLHMEEGDDEVALKCGAISKTCPACQHPIQLQEGYLSTPQFLAEA